MTRLHKHLEEVPTSVCYPLFAAQDMMVETIKVSMWSCPKLSLQHVAPICRNPFSPASIVIDSPMGIEPAINSR